MKNSLLELEKDFIELKDRELKDREVKIKREIEELFFKPLIMSLDDMDKFEQKEMKKIRLIKNTWYDWLINYIPEPLKKAVRGFKDKIVSLFRTNTAQQTMCGRRKKLRILGSFPSKFFYQRSCSNIFNTYDKQNRENLFSQWA